MSAQKVRVSVDTGKGLGYAIWDELHWLKKVPPLEAGTFEAKGRMQGLDDVCRYAERVRIAVRRLSRLLKQYDVVEFIVEWPEYFDSHKGRTAARRGDLAKLIFSAGVVFALAAKLGAAFTPVTANRWKGQVKKPVMQRRITRILGAEACRGFDAHAMDAVGLGLGSKGFLKKKEVTRG